MKTTNTRIGHLKEMITLEEKRAALESQITGLDQRLAVLQSELYGSSATKAKAKAAPIKVARKQRGALKGQILETLQAAGPKGVAVLDLARMLGTKPANIHSWFSVNFKKIANLKKVGAAQYALNGGAPAAAPKAAPAVKTAKPKKAGKKPVKVVKAPKAAKPAEAVKAPKAVKTARKVKAGKASTGRGELKSQILDALKGAGEQGMTVKDLSEKLGAKYKNLYIWFVTTGKRTPGIKKVGPAKYSLQAA